MKYVLPLLALTFLSAGAGPLQAAWYGIHGPFTTFPFQSATGGIGLPTLPGAKPITVIAITCSDPTITGVRAVVTYHDAAGDHQSSFTSQLDDGRGGVTIPAPMREIVDVKYIELHDGASY